MANIFDRITMAPESEGGQGGVPGIGTESGESGGGDSKDEGETRATESQEQKDAREIYKGTGSHGKKSDKRGERGDDGDGGDEDSDGDEGDEDGDGDEDPKDKKGKKDPKDDKGKDGKEREGIGADPDSVPDDGIYNLTMPKGVELDQALLDRVAPILKERGLTHSDVQELADAFIDVSDENAAEKQEEMNGHIKEWTKQSKADKEIGGDDFDKNVAIAAKALETHGTKELSKLLYRSGLGSHPEVIRFFVKVGTLTSDDHIPDSSGKSGADPTSLEAMARLVYPKTPSRNRR